MKTISLLVAGCTLACAAPAAEPLYRFRPGRFPGGPGPVRIMPIIGPIISEPIPISRTATKVKRNVNMQGGDPTMGRVSAGGADAGRGGNDGYHGSDGDDDQDSMSNMWKRDGSADIATNYVVDYKPKVVSIHGIKKQTGGIIASHEKQNNHQRYYKKREAEADPLRPMGFSNSVARQNPRWTANPEEGAAKMPQRGEVAAKKKHSKRDPKPRGWHGWTLGDNSRHTASPLDDSTFGTQSSGQPDDGSQIDQEGPDGVDGGSGSSNEFGDGGSGSAAGGATWDKVKRDDTYEESLEKRDPRSSWRSGGFRLSPPVVFNTAANENVKRSDTNIKRDPNPSPWNNRGNRYSMIPTDRTNKKSAFPSGSQASGRDKRSLRPHGTWNASPGHGVFVVSSIERPPAEEGTPSFQENHQKRDISDIERRSRPRTWRNPGHPVIVMSSVGRPSNDSPPSEGSVSGTGGGVSGTRGGVPGTRIGIPISNIGQTSSTDDQN